MGGLARSLDQGQRGGVESGVAQAVEGGVDGLLLRSRPATSDQSDEAKATASGSGRVVVRTAVAPARGGRGGHGDRPDKRYTLRTGARWATAS